MKRAEPPNRPGRGGVSVLLTLTVLLLVSGSVWLVLDTAFTVEGEFGPAKHPLQVWMLRAHAAFAMAMLVAFGSLLPSHVWPLWSTRCNRGSGAMLVALVLGLVLTGYLLYYLGDEDWRTVVARMHWIGGLVLAGALVLHMVMGKRAAVRHKRARSRAVGAL
ncbi:MAG: hypothetical protein ACLGHO_06875 [Gammaproteobacteria bacterium]